MYVITFHHFTYECIYNNECFSVASLEYRILAPNTREKKKTQRQELGPVCPLFICKQVKPFTVNQHTGSAKHFVTFMNRL